MADAINRPSEDYHSDNANISVRRGSLIAGIALLVMTPLAAFANFFVLEDLITSGNAEQTASAILDAEGTFRFAIASLFLVAVLDLIVAWALYAVFKPVRSGIALLMAWFRVVFAGIFVVAISQLMGVVSILTTADSSSVFSTEQHYAQALLGINSFYDIWDGALIFVGLHLVILGYLLYKSGAVSSYKSGYIPRVLGVLLTVAGVGYVIDSFGRVLVTDYALEVAAFTFLGEVLLIFWLFIYGRRISLDEEVASGAN
jgi:predicted anti-sigma-YlaC factor YlaD